MIRIPATIGSKMRWNVQVAAGDVPVLADDEAEPTVVILAHGAGSHMEQKTIEWLTGLVRECGASVVRFNFLYRALGRSMPDRMPVLMETYRAVIASVREKLAPARLIIGGHSMGGRVASMIAADKPPSSLQASITPSLHHSTPVQGLLLFGYPLHPAGQPEKLRDAHLPAIETPTLQLNGTEDPLCDRAIMERVVAGLNPVVWRLKWIDGADHSYSVKKSSGRTRSNVESDIREAVSSWLGQI